MDDVAREAQQKQSDFYTCYRGRQGGLHHASYMRMSKVLLALQLCQESQIALEDKDIFDYGFGAGTFYRYCPLSSRLFGVELDSENVDAVDSMLRHRGYSDVDLRPIEIESWTEHPLLGRKYDLILCSHILEHLADPVGFLVRIRECLKDQGAFVGLVPLNERKVDPHHVQEVDRNTVDRWVRESGLSLKTYLEADPWLYWYQPALASEGLMRLATRGLCLGLGIPASLLGPRLWSRLSKPFLYLTASRPTQAGFVLTLADSR